MADLLTGSLLFQVQKLLNEGAQLVQMVELVNSNQKGTVVDFAYDAFNQVRKLKGLSLRIFTASPCPGMRLLDAKTIWSHGVVICTFSPSLFSQDRRMSQLRYVALTRAERVRYKSARRLTKYFLCLLRIKAVENVPGTCTHQSLQWLPLPRRSLLASINISLSFLLSLSLLIFVFLSSCCLFLFAYFSSQH